jgi:hypothetical protein
MLYTPILFTVVAILSSITASVAQVGTDKSSGAPSSTVIVAKASLPAHPMPLLIFHVVGKLWGKCCPNSERMRFGVPQWRGRQRRRPAVEGLVWQRPIPKRDQ